MRFQESVISTVIKLCLKSLQEFVRLQTLNRSGYQQIQLDMEFLKAPLKQLVDDDDGAIDFLLKEACMPFLVLTLLQVILDVLQNDSQYFSKFAANMLHVSPSEITTNH